MRLSFTFHRIVSLFIWAALLLGACNAIHTPTPPTPTPSVTKPVKTPTSIPTITPTPPPLGSPENPIVMGLVTTADNSEAVISANTLVSQIGEKTGLSIQVGQAATYNELLKSMDQKVVQFAWLPPLTYLLAERRDIAETALITNHFGVYSYGTQFLVNAEGGFTTFYDTKKNQSTADAANALRQFAGTRPCLSDPQSASGYVLPEGILSVEQIETKDPVISQDYSAVIRSLYIKGICDFGATYAISGDPRTGSSIQTDLPDVMDKVIVVWQTDPIIPNLNLSFTTGLSMSMRQKIVDALVTMVKSEDGKSLMGKALDYEIGDLKEIDDHYYDAFRTYVNASGVDLVDLTGR